MNTYKRQSSQDQTPQVLRRYKTNPQSPSNPLLNGPTNLYKTPQIQAQKFKTHRRIVESPRKSQKLLNFSKENSKNYSNTLTTQESESSQHQQQYFIKNNFQQTNNNVFQQNTNVCEISKNTTIGETEKYKRTILYQNQNNQGSLLKRNTNIFQRKDEDRKSINKNTSKSPMFDPYQQKEMLNSKQGLNTLLNHKSKMLNPQMDKNYENFLQNDKMNFLKNDKNKENENPNKENINTNNLSKEKVEESFKQFDYIIKKRQNFVNSHGENLNNKMVTQPSMHQQIEEKDQEVTLSHKIYREENINNFEFGKVLGLGSYAIVKYAIHTPTKLQVAIKTYDKKKLRDPMKYKNVQREINILSKLNHTNIIKLYKVIDTANWLHLIMEYVSYLPLNDFVKTKYGRFVTEDQAKIVVKQLASALEYCHRKNVVHRDVKFENVLVSKDFKVKLIDFGFSVVIPQMQMLNVFCGTPTYMAPEIVNKQNYSFGVDIWALGVLMFKLLSNEFPFKGSCDRDLFRKINNCDLRYPTHFSAHCRQFISRMLKVNYKDRIDAFQIMKYDWIDKQNQY